jgi:hypothetical protein
VKEGANPDVDEIRKLVSGRLSKVMADGPHADPNLLAALAENALPDADRKQLLQHLGGCADCREILYLAMPDSAVAQKALSLRPNRLSVFAWRWGAAAASVAIIAFLFVTGRHKMAAPDCEHQAMVAPAAPAPAQIVADNTSSELDRLPATQKEGRTEFRMEAKSVPVPKHMTAKPKAELAFDSSGQVHMLPPSTQNAPKDEEAGAAGKAASNSPTATTRRAAEQTAQDLKRDDRKLTEAVEVSAGAVPVSEEKQTATELQLQKAAALPHAPQSFSGYQADTMSVVVPQWKLSTKGAVQRSVDSGRTWQNITIAGQSVFRVVSALGPQVWAGGNAGVLYHSADSGANWTRIEPAAFGQKFTADITHIQFADALNGTVSASNGEVWATSDGGRSWQRK